MMELVTKHQENVNNAKMDMDILMELVLNALLERMLLQGRINAKYVDQ